MNKSINKLTNDGWVDKLIMDLYRSTDRQKEQKTDRWIETNRQRQTKK